MSFLSVSVRGRVLKLSCKDFHSIRCSLHPEHQDLLLRLKSCTNTWDINRVHCYMIKTGLEQDTFALSKLLAFTSHDIKYAFSIFREIREPNLFMFNTLLRGSSASDNPRQAFVVFNSLRSRGISLDQFSFVTTLKSCSRESEIEMGMGIHGIAVKSGNGLFINVKNTLMLMYCTCGRIADAHDLFDELSPRNDHIAFNTLMNGYLSVHNPHTVVILYKEMLNCGLRVSISSLLCVLSAAGNLGYFIGRTSVHAHCIKVGYDTNLNLITSLIDMYSKTGGIDSARRLFDGIAEKDVVLWNCMIDKYAKMGLLHESWDLLRQMKVDNVKPNSSTLVGMISSCAAYVATDMGRSLGDLVEAEGMVLDAVLGTALVDMYSKLGALAKAVDVFERMEEKDVKSWTAMISAFGAYGLADKAISVFERMEEQCQPNEVTFLAILNACSHGGLLEEGTRCLDRMVEVYGLVPKVEHYGCVIDLLGRAGLLTDAYGFITRSAIKSDATAWRALLAACRIYGDVELAERVRKILYRLGERHPSDSILLSWTHAAAGSIRGVPDEEDESKLNPTKKAGLSAIDVA